MKTLSEDITLELPTTNMQQGYVNTLIYHNNAEIFAGRTYIPGNNSSLYVNINPKNWPIIKYNIPTIEKA